MENKISYALPGKVSSNPQRMRALMAKSYVKTMLRECIGCGRKFHPYVDFPLVYSDNMCTACKPEQPLKRYKDSIPFVSKNIFELSLSILSRNGKNYPTCKDVFHTVMCDSTVKIIKSFQPKTRSPKWK